MGEAMSSISSVLVLFERAQIFACISILKKCHNRKVWQPLMNKLEISSLLQLTGNFCYKELASINANKKIYLSNCYLAHWSYLAVQGTNQKQTLNKQKLKYNSRKLQKTKNRKYYRTFPQGVEFAEGLDIFLASKLSVQKMQVTALGIS